MHRFILVLAFLFFSDLALAQQPFHWELTNGPGTDAPLVLEINTNGDIIVGSDSVILRSSDHGIHWQAFPNSGFGYLQAAATLPGGRVVVLTSLSMLVRFESDGSGRTVLNLPYAQILYGDRTGNLYSIVGPSSPLSLPEGPDSLLARSTNAGDTWQMIPGPRSQSMECFAADEEHYYVATDSGIYISSDSGSSWQRCQNGVPIGQYYNVTAGYKGHVWATNSRFIPFLSTDFGQTWKQLSTGGAYAYKMAVHSDNHAMRFGLQSLVYLVDTNCTLITDSLFDPRFNSPLAAVDSNDDWIASSTLNIPSDVNLYSSSGGTPWVWNPMPAPLSSPSLLILAYSSVLAQAGKGNYLADTNNNWHFVSPDSNIITGMDFYDTSLLATTSQGGLFRSFDTGWTWTNIFPSGPALKTYAVAGKSGVIYAGSAGVFRSVDDGKTWNRTNDAPITSAITALALDSDGTLYAGNAHGLFVSSDSGNTWILSTKAGRVEIDHIEANYAGTIAVGGIGSQIHRSTDHGATWETATIPAGMQATSIAVLASGDIIASSASGVWYWPAGSTSMFDAGDGLQGRGVSALATDTRGTLYAAVNGVGVWKGVGEFSLLDVATNPLLVSEIAASPNPASALVRIPISYPGNWKVFALDMLGRTMPLTYSMGVEEAVCDVSKFPNGSYEFILQSDSSQMLSRILVEH